MILMTLLILNIKECLLYKLLMNMEVARVLFSALKQQQLLLRTNPYDDNFTSNIYQFTPSPGVTLADSWTSATISTTNADVESLVTLNPTPVKATNTMITTIYAGSTTLWFVIEYNESVMNYINNVRAAEIREVVYVDDVIYYIGDGA